MLKIPMDFGIVAVDINNPNVYNYTGGLYGRKKM